MVDGDGQMGPSLIPEFVAPILAGEVDYTKGNRFFDLEEIRAAPKIRLFGNVALSFMTKLSSGYWDLFGPTNGFTAIHRDVAMHLPLEKISRRYFFETDMLFRLNTLRPVVVDVSMDARYGDEVSNLKISKIIGEFLLKYMRNFTKRISIATTCAICRSLRSSYHWAFCCSCSACLYGGANWASSLGSGTAAPAGTVMLAALPVILGAQLIPAFIGYDIAAVPKKALHKRLRTFGRIKSGTNSE